LLKSSGLKLIGSGKGIFIYTICFAARAEVIPLRDLRLLRCAGWGDSAAQAGAIPLRRLSFVFRMLAKG
ncbi:hypothetical protein OAD32_06355, partial [Porticoccaceae bacterium]|nr:hypothetical protein [Porticoccaceae bacterium]